ncbi:hypothetical protein Rsub_03730 [Raphidocelis subcapitata]|uniref:N-acetyltransferase domain-containing protein n=1 Tax=Raphidocelis subcapitata TaxID=307507 RepID=A0A2V0NTC0_9CHLO|nr:hypothetical protein Rsub_03730 [Raphidocelis subcapitata]|eukprot:GBF90876.1 hypothetical protein Rsub_03730 [Raphidocelis subcapitata]
MSSSRPHRSAFSVGPALPGGLAQSQASHPGLVFLLRPPNARQPPFAHLLGGRRAGPPPARVLPFARAHGDAGGEDARFANYLRALVGEEASKDAGDGEPKPKHDNVWYQERCALCAACRTAVDAEPGRRGTRCAGCRRWFHAKCCGPRKAGGDGADQGAGHGTASGSSGSSGAAVVNGRFFHSPDCSAGYEALAREAAKGRRPLASPPQQPHGLFGGLFGSRQPALPAGSAPLTVRLIDLSEAKRQYKSLAESGLLHARRQRALEAAGLASPAPRRGGARGSDSDGDTSSSEAGGAGAGGRRRGGAAAIDDFLVAAELLTQQWPDDTPKDILEDSFALLLRAGDGPALAAATLNLYAPDHARLQAVVSAPDRRRRGHASALVSELHGILSGAGLSRVVAAVIDDARPGAQSEARAARDGLLRRRLGYRDLPIEELVELRRDNSDYHPQLLGAARLLVRPLEARSGPGGGHGGE